jgi:hypothetical protein
MLPKNMFITEYLGEFLDSESIVFGDFMDCICNDITPYNDIYVGIDWGSGVGSDDTVITAINEHNQQVFMLAFNNKTALQQIDYIVEYLQAYGSKIKHILAECNGLGKPLCDNLRVKLKEVPTLKKIPFTEWATTNANKIELINRLQVAFEQRKVQILDDERQTAELSMYEAKVKENGTITYNAPTGGNDDMVMGLMFAMESKRSKCNKANYSVSII